MGAGQLAFRRLISAIAARRRRDVGHGVPLARLHEREEALELGASPEGRAEGPVGLRGSGVNVFAAMETLGPLDKRSGARAVSRIVETPRRAPISWIVLVWATFASVQRFGQVSAAAAAAAKRAIRALLAAMWSLSAAPTRYA